MSSRRGKNDSTSVPVVAEGVAAISAAEIETIVQKAVSAAVNAAVSVLREELTKLIDNVGRISGRVEEMEKRLDALEVKYNTLLPSENASSSEEIVHELELVKKETKECRIAANENEQFSRRNNIRIRGLTIAEGRDCRQAVTEFCCSKLHMDNVDESTIDVAHILPSRPKSTTTGDKSTTAASQTTEPAVIVKFHRRDLRDAVISKRKALKGTKYSILEDLTNLNVKTLNRVRNDDRVQNCWSWNGRIYAVLKSGLKILVKPFQPLNECQTV